MVSGSKLFTSSSPIISTILRAKNLFARYLPNLLDYLEYYNLKKAFYDQSL